MQPTLGTRSPHQPHLSPEASTNRNEGPTPTLVTIGARTRAPNVSSVNFGLSVWLVGALGPKCGWWGLRVPRVGCGWGVFQALSVCGEASGAQT